MSSSDAGGATLRRAVTRWEIVGLALNDVIGSGIYLLPAAAAAVLGPASLPAVVAAGVIVALIVLCFAEAASYFDEPGGAYLYTRVAFGDFIGFQVGWMAWLTRVAALASLSVGFAQALAFLVPAVEGGLGRTLAVVVPLLTLSTINIGGVKGGVRTASVLVIGKVVPLLVFIFVGVFYFSGPVLRGQTAAAGGGGFGQAALLLLFAFAGFENTSALAGESLSPRRDVPFALLTQITLVTVIYAAVQAVCLGVLPNLASSSTPLADSATLFLGSWGGWLLTAGAVLSILGTNSNTILAGPRYLFALAQDGFMPRALAVVHPKTRTPATAIALQTLIALPLALTGSFEELATLSVVARLATYLGTAAAVPVLRRKLTAPEGAFRLPGGVLIPVVAGVLALALGASASRQDLVAAAVALVVGAVLYGVSRLARDRLR
jgi:APA family basic amino acid/polyamine antiporter